MSAKPKQPGMGDLFANLMQQAQQGQKQEWWKSYHYPEAVIFNVSRLIDFAKSALYAKAISSVDLVVYENSYIFCMEENNSVSSILELENLEDFIKKFNARLLYNFNKDSIEKLFYVFGALDFSKVKNHITINLVTTSKKKRELFGKYCKLLNV